MPAKTTKPEQKSKRAPKPVELAANKARAAKVLFVLGLAMFALGAGLFVFNQRSAEQARRVSDQFVEKLQAKDAAAAYGLTDEEFREATSQDQLTDLFDRVAPILDGEPEETGFNVSQGDNYGTMAVLTYEIPSTKDEKTYYMKVQVQKEGDGWQVFSFRTSATALEAKVE